jgi:hypothetical protein
MQQSRARRAGAAFSTILFVLGLIALAGEVHAGDLALRAGAYTDADSAFVGIEYRTPLDGRLHLAPNFELVFPEHGSYFSFNGDVHYLFPTSGRVTSWAGGGLGLYMWDSDGGGRDTSVGANFIGGLGLRAHLEPHLQLKIAIHGDTEVVLGFGIRF